MARVQLVAAVQARAGGSALRGLLRAYPDSGSHVVDLINEASDALDG
ncbi:hypothetical protein LFM09_38885 [Lentzea alba]